MERPSSPLIDQLVADLAPAPPMRAGVAIARAVAATGAAIAVIAALMGLRSHVSPLFLLGTGLFGILGMAAALSVVAMARPRVGSDRTGWLWAAAMAALLPATALVMATAHAPSFWVQSDPASGIVCLAMGLLAGLGSAAVLIAWLRRGAPTSPERAGLTTGIAAGSLGMFAFSLHCPSDDLYHIGLWHTAPVIIAAMLGRAIIPRLIRW